MDEPKHEAPTVAVEPVVGQHETKRCAGCDIPNGCPEYCRCTPGRWQPIETAPKCGKGVLVTGLEYGRGPGRWQQVAHYVDGTWLVMSDPPPTVLYQPTHWMPLPLPPNAEINPRSCPEEKPNE